MAKYAVGVNLADGTARTAELESNTIEEAEMEAKLMLAFMAGAGGFGSDIVSAGIMRQKDMPESVSIH